MKKCSMHDCAIADEDKICSIWNGRFHNQVIMEEVLLSTDSV